MKEEWAFEPSHLFLATLKIYQDRVLKNYPDSHTTEREFEINADIEKAERDAFIRFLHKLSAVTKMDLDPKSLPVYVRKNRTLPNVRTLHEEPFTAFFAPNDSRVWIGLLIVSEEDITENSFENFLIRIFEEARKRTRK